MDFSGGGMRSLGGAAGGMQRVDFIDDHLWWADDDRTWAVLDHRPRVLHHDDPCRGAADGRVAHPGERHPLRDAGGCSYRLRHRLSPHGGPDRGWLPPG